MAVSNKKIIYYEIYNKAVSGITYISFIKNLINISGNYYTLLMDNATIHKTKKLNKFVNENQIKILYNIPYNPETNPIELLFGSLKRMIKTNNSKSLQNIKKSIENYIKQIKKESLKNIFIKALTEK
jgi:transposase